MSKMGLLHGTSTALICSCFSLKPPLLFSSTSALTIYNISVLNSQRLSLSFVKDGGCKVSCSKVKMEDTLNDEACELVNGVELSLGEGTDSINAYLCTAVKNNNGTGVLLLSDIFGFEDSATRDFAYRVACNGYNVLVPDLFRGDPWEKGRPQTSFEPWLANQSPERVAKDIDTWIRWMVDEFVAAGISKKLGVLGFCFGGGRVLDVLARDQGACFGIGVSFYGTRIDPNVAASVKVPVLFIAGDNDPLCPVSGLQEIEKNIVEGSKVVIYKGRGHGFAHRPQSAEEDADADEAFTVMRNWLYNGLVLVQ
ncbi:uncharacterized protein LOC108201740 isoform X1 [Daucus carota subsp. sativus]|uniref:uncharacterized protein LOC108201740 isoform X1 n=1 Tax=Daucus carota subsp. sativus TaxID=79200 RepID=UPI0007F0162A|nr:PREDICTED: carboxymethylenebutenolidase homolog isoform X1 [Daucus carota subsp. sativus]XP_017225524.1 PREDICTED: carboxymethylenebutenolidase homolog isoform X1 [Daucus carota subsp. sativus]